MAASTVTAGAGANNRFVKGKSNRLFNMFQQSELDALIFNDPKDYTEHNNYYDNNLFLFLVYFSFNFGSKSFS